MKIKNQNRKVAGFAVAGIIIFFLFSSLLQTTQSIDTFLLSIEPGLLIFSIFVLICSTLFRATIWRKMVIATEPGRGFSYFRSMVVFVYSWVSRYVPGKIAPILGKGYFGSEENPSQENLYISGIFELIIPLSAALLLSVSFLPFLPTHLDLNSPWVFIVLFSVGTAILIRLFDSVYFYRIINWVIEKIGKDPIAADRRFTATQTLSFFVGFSVSHLLRGVAFFLLVMSVTSVGVAALPKLVGAFIVATTAGVISLITPAGIGVVEGVLIVTLQTVMPVESAVQVALFSRLWDITADSILAGSVYLLDKSGVFT